MDLFFQLMLGAFLGAAAGYYTNTIALKKLFSNNGIIAREKDRFIDEISIMISKKIINYDSIYKEIIKDKFQNNIKEFFKKIKNQLISKTDIKIKNVAGFNESKENIINWIKTDANENILTILNELSKNIKLEQIIDESQFKHIIKSITESFISYEKNNHFILNAANKIYKNNNEKYKDILKEISDNIINNLSNNNKKIESLLISLINNLNIENLFYDFFFSLSDKKIKELFSINDILEIKDIIKELSNKKEFENIVDYVIDKLYMKLKNTDKTIYELLNHNISDRIKDIVSDILPKLIDIIIPIINENKSKLECIIEKAVDEEIENIDGVFWQFIVKAIRKVFLNDIASKYKIVNKIIEYTQKYKDNNEKLVEAVCDDIINYLNNTKISKILKSIEVNEDTLKNVLRDIVIFNIKEFPNSLIEKFLNMKISLLADSYMIKELYSFVEKEIIKYAVSNFDKVSAFVYKKIDSINEETLNKFFYSFDISVIIKENKSSIENYLYNVYLKYKEKTINDLFNNSIYEEIINLFETIIDKYSDYNINEIIIKKEKQIDNFFNNNAYSSIIKFINKEKDFISSVIDSIVIKTIKNNMGKLNKDEIAKMANDFMGKELEPINILGAFLGFVFGLLTAYLFPVNSFNPSLGYLNYIAEPLVYTFIGFITNVLAIYSIFKPYEPLFGIKKKVFWGAVACEKSRFASSMSDFVNDRLMEKEGIISILENKKDIEDNLIKDNYKKFFNYMLEDEKINKLNIFSYLKESINTIIINNIDFIKTGIIKLIIKNNYIYNIIKNNKEVLINYINDNIFSVLKLLLSNINIINLKDFIKNIIIDNIKDLSKFKNIIVLNATKAINSNSVRDRIFYIAAYFIDNEISKNSSKKIKEMFGGEIVNLVRSNSEFIFSMMSKKLNETLLENRYEIRETIIKDIPLKNDLVIDLTDRIILNLINKKIPIFIDDMKYDIMNISFNFLDENILSKNVSYFIGQNSNEKLYEENSLRKYLNDTINNNEYLILNVFDKLFDFSVKNIDYKLIEKYTQSFLENTDIYFYELIRKLCISIYNNRYKVTEDIKNYIESSLYPTTIKECLNIEKYFDDILKDIFKYSDIERLLLYDNLIDLNNFIISIYNILDNLDKNEYINSSISEEIKKIISKLRNDIPFIIDDKLKYYFLNLIINCAEDDINLIIDAIDFSAITKEEIDKMNAKNIHDVFNSFAKKYLTRLKLYGMFGGFVGVFLVIIKYIGTFNTEAFNILNIILIIITIILSISMIISILKNISD
ncbi:transcriptional regulator [Brachyspira murdochii]|uniref:DUF445 family protein n=1 Tax=Brachyspira murdochii (strain ATCC 51284 / DSM 12563 / 56-150) TaxID=526224 RepID=D5U8U9_BRAM5|nr:hypothetical protein [Brachyspira murdochii]ADG71122.1 hypothetical protein Bmur_1026 [Brachyspira murdochii DSM 12563]